MTFQIRASSMAVVLAGVLLAGCAGDSTDGLFTTGALSGTQTASKVDPACVTLAASIDGLRKEGIAEKIEKAAAKKYKMTATDLKKADQLTKANADFQARCSTVGPKSATAQAPSTGSATPKTSVGLANPQ
jgi:outer membrane murein-binding lipoprotein Lpp